MKRKLGNFFLSTMILGCGASWATTPTPPDPFQAATSAEAVTAADKALPGQKRLVDTAMVDYIESGALKTDLNSITSPTDGYMGEAHALRKQVAADSVTLIEETTAGAALDELFYQPAFNVTDGLDDYAEDFSHHTPPIKQVAPSADTDLPLVESLTEDPEVSEKPRRVALRELFHQPAFNVTDGLADYAEDFSRHAPPVEQVALSFDTEPSVVESLTEDPEVGEKPRRVALRELFHQPAFNVTDGLDDYADDLSHHAEQVARSPDTGLPLVESLTDAQAVSEKSRQLALRKPFHQPAFNVAAGRDD